MKLKENLRSRNLGLDSYMSILAITIVGSLATFYILHVALDVPFKTFLASSTYAIDPSL